LEPEIVRRSRVSSRRSSLLKTPGAIWLLCTKRTPQLGEIWHLLHQSGTILVMSVRAAAHPQESTIARTIRIPVALRKRIAADAERCGRSFEGQVLALLRRHYGEDVDIAPGPAGILALAVASLADIPAAERDLLTRKLEERER
jgi:hypothetical protein